MNQTEARYWKIGRLPNIVLRRQNQVNLKIKRTQNRSFRAQPNLGVDKVQASADNFIKFNVI